jgi:hypothetical protein
MGGAFLGPLVYERQTTMAFPRPFRCSSINDLSKMVPFIGNILPTIPGYDANQSEEQKEEQRQTKEGCSNASVEEHPAKVIRHGQRARRSDPGGGFLY